MKNLYNENPKITKNKITEDTRQQENIMFQDGKIL